MKKLHWKLNPSLNLSLLFLGLALAAMMMIALTSLTSLIKLVLLLLIVVYAAKNIAQILGFVPSQALTQFSYHQKNWTLWLEDTSTQNARLIAGYYSTQLIILRWQSDDLRKHYAVCCQDSLPLDQFKDLYKLLYQVSRLVHV